MAHVASGGGWQTTFTLVNTGTSPAQAQMSFFDDNGNPLSLPLTFLQSGSAMSSTTLSQTIDAGASLVLLTQGSNSGASVVGLQVVLTRGKRVNSVAIAEGAAVFITSKHRETIMERPADARDKLVFVEHPSRCILVIDFIDRSIAGTVPLC